MSLLGTVQMLINLMRRSTTGCCLHMARSALKRQVAVAVSHYWTQRIDRLQAHHSRACKAAQRDQSHKASTVLVSTNLRGQQGFSSTHVRAKLAMPAAAHNEGDCSFKAARLQSNINTKPAQSQGHSFAWMTHETQIGPCQP